MVTENFLNTALWSVGFISVISHAITCLTSTFDNYGYMVMVLTKLFLTSYFLAIITPLRSNSFQCLHQLNHKLQLCFPLLTRISRVNVFPEKKKRKLYSLFEWQPNIEQQKHETSDLFLTIRIKLSYFRWSFSRQSVQLMVGSLHDDETH